MGDLGEVIDDPVTIWLWELRSGFEQECSALLVSKPIIPRNRQSAGSLHRRLGEKPRKLEAIPTLEYSSHRRLSNLKNISQSKPELSNRNSKQDMLLMTDNSGDNAALVERNLKFPSQYELSSSEASQAQGGVKYSDSKEELFLGGHIPVGMDSSNLAGLSNSETDPEDSQNYGIPLLTEHESQTSSQSHLRFNYNNAEFESSEMERNHSESKHSGFSTTSDDSGNCSRSFRESDSHFEDSNPWQSRFEEKQMFRTSHDSDSLDSARGSSPSCPHSPETSPNNSARQLNKLHQSSISSAHANGLPFLHSYVELKDAIDGILALTSQIFSHFGSGAAKNKLWPDKCIHAVEGLLWLLESSGIYLFLSHTEFCSVRDGLELLRQRSPNEGRKQERFSEFLRRFIEKVLAHVGKIILRHISENGNQNPDLPSALEQLAHVALFGEGICLQLIQLGSISYLIRLCRHIWTPTEVVRLCLRAAAVLCGASKGCVQLLSIGGLDLIVRLLVESPFVSAVEAAGVLTQLTAPCHSFATLPPNLHTVISRLLDLCEQCTDSESFLLCVAALANLSLQHSSVSDQLYRHNAVLRLSATFRDPKSRSIFVHDQIVTLFARLSANGYDQALIAQGAVPCLLYLLKCEESRQKELRLRIRYKAAICLGTLASNSFGLQAIHHNKGCDALRRAIESERSSDSEKETPIALICNSLLTRLLSKYQQVSAV